MQLVLDKGLGALSVQELAQLLTKLGLACFVQDFKTNHVRAAYLFYLQKSI